MYNELLLLTSFALENENNGIIIMRFNFKCILITLISQLVVSLIVLSYLRNWIINKDISSSILRISFDNQIQNENNGDKLPYKEIICNINDEENILCRKEPDEIYIPFSFIRRYFEIYGKVVEHDGVERLDWSHSYANIYRSKTKYNPHGVFTHFQNYRVEERDRVMCVTASEGVPLSTQWNPNGYYYPTQIAQFGLAHYSRSLTEHKPLRKILENADVIRASWISSNKHSTIERIHDSEINSMILRFSNYPGGGLTLKVNSSSFFTLKVDLKLGVNKEDGFAVVVHHLVDNQRWMLHYTCSDDYISYEGYNIYHGMKCDGKEQWKKITRDLIIDLQKGILLKRKLRPKLSRSSIVVVEIILRGKGAIDNLIMSTNEHISHFYSAVEWFVNHQNQSSGAWQNLVTRKMAGVLKLNPGWCSAMSQGHGISLLSRAYHHSGNEMKYLNISLKALSPFQTLSKDGGVLAVYMNNTPWYEEYPTTPATFVLNGFIYSLLGLYDLMTLAPQSLSGKSKELFHEGMKSLKKLLMAFDTGSGTTYDLRHISLGIAPKIARWDYHATHINQLFLLSTIDKDPLFTTTAKRWLGYMKGKRASHN